MTGSPKPQMIDHPLVGGVPPRWAHTWGQDRYGVFVGMVLQGVEQRFRWIPPGTFLMGSPKEEVGRYESEPLPHAVTIAGGFWLGDTPCTQAFWEAMGGENRSRFRSPDRPVENVSYDSVVALLKRLNGRLPEQCIRLPTEAEWEYACRAGSPTATCGGDLEIVGANNAPVLDDIAWYGGNCGAEFELKNGADISWYEARQFAFENGGSHPVGRKRPNPWGLFDMLGNVYEWCEDVYDKQAREFRVIRGGSWRSYARDVRAALRRGVGPSYRDDYVGFRLARGHELPASVPK